MEALPLLTALPTLGARLRYARLQRGWTQRRLAREAGYRSPSTVAHLEKDEAQHPREEAVLRIARALRVSGAWLVDGTGDPPL
jgi:transcriptional regulator with XRE-family HTH domain